MPNHIIVTRFLIGICRPSAFRRNAQILLRTLYPAMKAQTSQDFTWVVVTDNFIDEGSEALLREAFSRHGNFFLEKVDPFTAQSLTPRAHVLCEKILGTTKDVLTTRIDDDDAVCPTFVHDLQTHMRENLREPGKLASFSFRRGVRLDPTSSTCEPSVRDHTSVGMSLYAPDVRKANVYTFNHMKIHTQVVEHGGRSFVIDNPLPAWLTVVRANSDSNELKRMKEGDAAHHGGKQAASDAATGDLAGILAHFSLAPSFPSEICAVYERFPDIRADIFDKNNKYGQQPRPRLILKKGYLAMAIQRIRKLPSVETEEEGAKLQDEIELLRQAFYLV